MKLLSKEEEDAHYREVLKGGAVGGLAGLVGGLAGVMAASRRFHAFRSLSLPFRAFLVTSTGTFTGIIGADHASRSFEAERNTKLASLIDRDRRLREEHLSQLTLKDRVVEWGRREKYKIIGATWILSIAGSFALVSRNRYLTGQQKIVQARVYAQGLTLAVMCATAAFEISDQRKGQGMIESKLQKKARPSNVVESPVHRGEDPENDDLWKDMVEAEEQRLEEKEKKAAKENHKEKPEKAEKKTAQEKH